MRGNMANESKKPAKTKKNTTEKLKTEIKYHHPYQYWTSFDEKGLPIGKQLEIAHETVQAALEKDQYTLLGALRKLRIPRPTFQVWLTKYPIIAAAYEEAKVIITDKRFNGAATRDASEKLFNFVPQYAEDYADYVKWNESVKAANQQNALPPAVNVLLTDFSKLTREDLEKENLKKE